MVVVRSPYKRKMLGSNPAGSTINSYARHIHEVAVAATSCPCCKSCWAYAAGPYEGRCVYGGPFTGYVRIEEGE